MSEKLLAQTVDFNHDVVELRESEFMPTKELQIKALPDGEEPRGIVSYFVLDAADVILWHKAMGDWLNENGYSDE